MTEKEKMQAGEWFSPNDEELVRDRARARHLTHRLNVALKDKDATYLATLRELCPRVEAMIRAPSTAITDTISPSAKGPTSISTAFFSTSGRFAWDNAA